MSERNPALVTLYVIAGVSFAAGCIVWLVQTMLPSPASVAEIGASFASSAQLIVLAIVLIAIGVLSGIAALHATAVARATYNAAWPDDRR